MDVDDDHFSEEFNVIVKQECEESNEGLMSESTMSPVKVKIEPPEYYECQPTESYDDKLIIKKEIEIDIRDPFEKDIKCEGTSNSIDTKENIHKIEIKVEPLEKKKCKIFYCNFCNYSASKTPLVKAHMRVHGYDTFACKDCSFTTEKFGRLTQHFKVHTGVKRFNCPHCVYKISSKTSFESHMKLHADDKSREPLRCVECSFVTVSRQLLKQHTRSHTGERVYNCNWCKYTGDTIRELRVHLISHGLTRFTCDKCPYTVNRHGTFRTHMAIHTRKAIKKEHILRKQIYKCDHCVYEVTKKILLKKHMELHFSDGSVKTFNCKECSYVASEPHVLTRHMIIHTGVNPYSCNWCNYTATEQHKLFAHMSVHNLKEFACKDCEFTTNNYRVLMRHLDRIHLICDHCSYMTSHKSYLETHMKFHMEGQAKKSFKCHVCSYVTGVWAVLTHHMAIHTGEKPFKCSYCTYRSYSKYHLREHVKYHTGTRVRCDMCPYETITKSKLNKHKKRKHCVEISETIYIKNERPSDC